MTSYLITGTTGYIGQRLTEQLQKSGHQIYSLSRNGIHSDPPWSADSTNFLRCDLEERDFSQLSGLNIQDGVLIDLAWDFSGRPHQEQVQDHLFLATAAIESGIRRIVSFGTLFELAFNQGEIDEDSPRLGNSVHGLAKALLHNSLERLCYKKGASLLWPRVHYVYGEDSRSRSIFGKILSHPKPFPLNPRQGRFDFIGLGDLVDKIEFLLSVPSEGGY